MSSAESPVRQFEYDSKACLILDFTGTKNTRVVSVSCLWGFFLESNEIKNCGEDGKLGRSRMFQEKQYHFK